ncbi:MAG: hypothetical protein JW780_07870 [Clostridiales bacterium]|nr:hypothetical protein [Clostridiales bacterium]
MKRKLATIMVAFLLLSTVLFLPAGLNVNAATILYNRSYTVTRMTDMARIYWTPKANFSVLNKSGGTYYPFTKGVKYYGMPYTWIYDNTLWQMSSKCTWDSTQQYRIFDNSGTFGNDCSTAVALAWQAGGCSIPSWYDTETMLSSLKSGSPLIKKVGNYSTGYSNTQYMVMYNDIESAYTLLKPGDACFYRYPGKGHAILIYKNYPNATTPYVLAIEQVGYYSNFTGSGKTTWYYLKKYEYQELAAKYHVPITNDVFINTDEFNGW